MDLEMDEGKLKEEIWTRLYSRQKGWKLNGNVKTYSTDARSGTRTRRFSIDRAGDAAAASAAAAGCLEPRG